MHAVSPVEAQNHSIAVGDGIQYRIRQEGSVGIYLRCNAGCRVNRNRTILQESLRAFSCDGAEGIRAMTAHVHSRADVAVAGRVEVAHKPAAIGCRRIGQ